MHFRIVIETTHGGLKLSDSERALHLAKAIADAEGIACTVERCSAEGNEAVAHVSERGQVTRP